MGGGWFLRAHVGKLAFPSMSKHMAAPWDASHGHMRTPHVRIRERRVAREGRRLSKTDI
jgi:hypothetical protein